MLLFEKLQLVTVSEFSEPFLAYVFHLSEIDILITPKVQQGKTH